MLITGKIYNSLSPPLEDCEVLLRNFCLRNLGRAGSRSDLIPIVPVDITVWRRSGREKMAKSGATGSGDAGKGYRHDSSQRMVAFLGGV